VLIGLGLFLVVRRTGLLDNLFPTRPSEAPAAQATVEGTGRPVDDSRPQG
jgi:hypothetical protein